METIPPVQVSPSAPAPVMSLAGRLSNVIAAPGEAFDHIIRSGGSVTHWLVPALLITLVGWIGSALLLTQPAFQQQLTDLAAKPIEKQVQAGKMPKEAAETAIKVAGMVTKAGMFVGAPVAALAQPFWWGLILWLVGAKKFKGGFTYMQAVEVAGAANMIGLLETVVRILLIFVTGQLFASPSLVLLVKDYDPQKAAHALLGLTNVMLFWLLAVRGIGLARLAKVSVGRAVVWVVVIWAGYTGLLMGWGFGMKALFGR